MMDFLYRIHAAAARIKTDFAHGKVKVSYRRTRKDGTRCVWERTYTLREVAE